MRLCRSKCTCNSIYKSSIHTSELCYRGLLSCKEIYARRGVVTVHFDDCDNTLADVANLPTTPITIQIRWQA